MIKDSHLSHVLEYSNDLGFVERDQLLVIGEHLLEAHKLLFQAALLFS